MFATAGGFALGVFIEFLQLTLLSAAALLGAKVAVGGGQILLGFLAFYSLLVWWPGRDLVEGWLGMLARRLPDRYRSRPENLGRAVLALAFAAFFLLLPAGGSTFEERAFGTAYLVLALLVFAIGGAIPRLWFAFRTDAWNRSEAIPQLLDEAGRRGAMFIVCIFLGIGVAFAAAQTAADRRGDAPREFRGHLCQKATKQCPAELTLDIERDGDSVLLVAGGGLDAMCVVTATGESRRGEHTLPLVGGHIAVSITLPAGGKHCDYYVRATPSKGAP